MEDKNLLIYRLECNIRKYKKKCRKAKTEFFRTYYLGQLFKNQETLRRLTGITWTITDAYWFN